MTSEESLRISSLAYDCPNSTLFVSDFLKMDYANDDTTDIQEIDLNICVAVQPYQFELLDRDSSSVSGSDTDTDTDRASAESDEECSRPSVKSSKQIIVRCKNSSIWKHYVVRTVRIVRTSDISCHYIAL